MFEQRRNTLLSVLDEAHEAYYKAEVFGGPSLYFHLRSLEASRAKDLDRFAESVYAVLPSWGMHRMGPRGSKMCEFQGFYDSLRTVWPKALSLQRKTPWRLSEADWNSFKEIFCGIHCMASGASLVGNSKVLAHLLPKLMPPIDRKYTLNFLFGNAQIINGIEREWTKVAQVLREFFYPLAESAAFQSKAKKWIAQRRRFKWDTSDLKVIDNLVIGYAKIVRV